MPQRIGRYTLKLTSSPSVIGSSSVVGKTEGEGPLGHEFDIICEDSFFGEKTWEKAESRMQKDAVNKALGKASLSTSDIDVILAGDLLNQGIAATYGLRDLDIPLLGVSGACSTMAETICIASVMVDSGAAKKCACVTSSHFCTAERQFRFPLEYGGQRTPTSQWTATGAGAALIGNSDKAPFIRAITIGKVNDLGVTDANNMGAAMAPAAADTIKQFLTDTNTKPSEYDMILTGDLGEVGTSLLKELLEQEGINISANHADCGLLIFDREKQDVKAGGSGCGCSASVLCSYIFSQIKSGALKNVLFIATGALMSTTSVQQGESIPGIAHLVHFSSEPWNKI